MLLVIFGHTFRESMRADFVWCDVSYVIVYRFHVSLLFLLSGLGYGFAAQRYREQAPGEFLRRKARSLLLPWLSYSVLMYLVFALIWAALPLRGMLSGSAYALISPGRYLLDMLGNENPYCFHVWYLQTLFLLTAAVYFCDRLLSPRTSRAVRITAVLLIPLLYELFLPRMGVDGKGIYAEGGILPCRNAAPGAGDTRALPCVCRCRYRMRRADGAAHLFSV